MRAALLASMIRPLQAVSHAMPPRFSALAARLVNPRRKRYLPRGVSAGAFLDTLRSRGIDHVVLRWFEDLPHVAAGHDIDLLVADEHAALLDDLVTYWPGGHPVDIYSVSGDGGYAYAPWFVAVPRVHQMAVFPPEISRGILKRAVLQDGRFRVPAPRDHLLSLAYHAAYLKGEHAGLTSRAQPDVPRAAGSHDYPATLRRLAASEGYDLPESPTFEDLDDMLGLYGWRPPIDVLERISAWSPWVHRRHVLQERGAPEGLVVFFIRDRAVREGRQDDITRALRSRGFDTILVKDLSDEERDTLARSTRGGNWGPGPYALSGGEPRCMVVAHDVMPQPASAVRHLHPLLDNLRVAEAKKLIRRAIIAGRPQKESYNAIHSTDNSREAWRLVRQVLPEEAPIISDYAHSSSLAFHAQGVGVRDLTRYGNRARVDLIEWNGRPAVRKTFKPHCEAYCAREIAALEALSGTGMVPRLLETGAFHLITEYVQDRWEGRVPVFLPLPLVRQMAAFLRHCLARGYDPVDLVPSSNVLLDPSGQLKFIDFEFCVDRAGRIQPEKSYCLDGVPPDFAGDVPVGSDHIFAPYRQGWFRYTGLSRGSFLHAPPWRQRLERALSFGYVMVRWRAYVPAKIALRDRAPRAVRLLRRVRAR